MGVRWSINLGGRGLNQAQDISVSRETGTVTVLGWSESNDLDVHDHLGGKDLVVFNLEVNDREVQSYMFGTLDDDWPLQIISIQAIRYAFGGTKVSERVLQPFWIKLN